MAISPGDRVQRRSDDQLGSVLEVNLASVAIDWDDGTTEVVLFDDLGRKVRFLSEPEAGPQ